jgi:hypothetical protein
VKYKGREEGGGRQNEVRENKKRKKTIYGKTKKETDKANRT